MGSSRNLMDFGFLSISQDEYVDCVKMESLKFRPLRVQAQSPKRKMKSSIKVKAPDLLEENEGSYVISRPYIRHWCRTKMKWSFRKRTAPGKKLAENIVELGDDMVKRIAYLVYKHDIP
ncbi:hypothetical protein R1sor_026851 [Riccia sorocarpa]|uniref:Uncharacterized protein n=1 Tax=Riccia sorocarpa TaxID=122646 RepID=A0ABD3GCI8_9MARC